MFDRHHVYWIGSIFQVLVMIALLMNMWWKRNCSGKALIYLDYISERNKNVIGKNFSLLDFARAVAS